MKTKCNNCGTQFIVAEEYRGKMVKCKRCQKIFQIAQIEVSPSLEQETVKNSHNDEALEEDVYSIRKKSEKILVDGFNKNIKDRKNKKKIVVGFIIVIILMSIFLPPMIWPHPLKNKTIGEISKLAQSKVVWSLDDFYKEFGKPKKKLLIGDEYYFYYDCKDGLVSLTIGKYALEQSDLVDIRDVSLY